MNSRVSARRTIILRKDYDYELAALHIIAYHQRSHVVPTFCVISVQGSDGKWLIIWNPKWWNTQNREAVLSDNVILLILMWFLCMITWIICFPSLFCLWMRTWNEEKVGEAHLPFSDLYQGIEEWLPLEVDSKFCGSILRSWSSQEVHLCVVHALRCHRKAIHQSKAEEGWTAELENSDGRW